MLETCYVLDMLLRVFSIDLIADITDTYFLERKKTFVKWKARPLKQ